MKTKKLLSLALCVVMVFAVTVPGLAVETEAVELQLEAELEALPRGVIYLMAKDSYLYTNTNGVTRCAFAEKGQIVTVNSTEYSGDGYLWFNITSTTGVWPGTGWVPYDAVTSYNY